MSEVDVVKLILKASVKFIFHLAKELREIFSVEKEDPEFKLSADKILLEK